MEYHVTFKNKAGGKLLGKNGQPTVFINSYHAIAEAERLAKLGWIAHIIVQEAVKA